ncbi:maltokinase N-terminal cap-like domain-containing protein [Rhodococcus sp. SJ-3]|uniref:maltokinase N-terminal cap-like domain-containing protein n=1 Tax=Rhodococcus sp. SJ-3 TaxID=3454628 RepID=UPI003F7AE9FA
MALLYSADLSPSKQDVITAWLPAADYYPGTAPVLEPLGAYRFDDPDGEVGIEIHLVRDADGAVYQVPLTYRGAPLPTAQLVGQIEHSVLGHRYVYDATTDPVYVTQLLATIDGGGCEAEQFVHIDGAEPRKITNAVRARGTGTGLASGIAVTEARCAAVGTDTVIEAGGATVVVHHRPVDTEPAGPALLGEWDTGRALLAHRR